MQLVSISTPAALLMSSTAAAAPPSALVNALAHLEECGMDFDVISKTPGTSLRSRNNSLQGWIDSGVSFSF